MFSLFRSLLLLALSTLALRAAAPATLTLNDLRSSDRWPAQVTLQRDFSFNGGAKASKGQSVSVVEFNGATLMVNAGKGLVFDVKPAETDFLEKANQAWSKLTPAQREITAATLLNDASLWPEKARANTGFVLDKGGEIPPGQEFEVISVSREGVTFYAQKYQTLLQADVGATDIVARAREVSLTPVDQRPSRIVRALKGKLVDATGKPVTPENLEQSQVFALYFGASWCGPCRAFSPSFVKYINSVAAQNPKLTVVILSNDKKDTDLFQYMQDEKMPWPAVLLSSLEKTPALMSYSRSGIPQLAIVDRYGKILSEAFQGPRYVGPNVPLQALTKLVASGAAK